MFWMKIHEKEGKEVLAICDEEIIEELNEKERGFYKGELVNEEKITQEMEKADNINLLGNKCTKVAEEKGIISKEGIKEIKGKKHAVIFRI